MTIRYLKRWLGSPVPKIMNLGGGSVLCDRWLTADVVARADVFVDVRQRLPLPEACVDVVFSEEVIEHISRDRDREKMLRECLRVLKSGGRLG